MAVPRKKNLADEAREPPVGDALTAPTTSRTRSRVERRRPHTSPEVGSIAGARSWNPRRTCEADGCACSNTGSPQWRRAEAHP